MTSVTPSPSRTQGGCSCGSTCSGNCSSEESFVRPLFFAGQLLTEADLQALTDYAVAKNRLHNRHLFGDGVVCGLEVTPHPCEPATVIVKPGLALDCCGNDLVLSCETQLDVNRMVRELRIKLRGGYDCGDPCASELKSLGAQSRAITSSATATPAYPSPTAGVAVPLPTPSEPSGENKRQRYCLYARYTETPSDPVSPYQTGESCNGSGCQPSRIREGVSFYLACPSQHQGELGMFERIRACLGDLLSAEKNLSIVRAYQYLALQVGRAVQHLDEPVRFEETDGQALDQHRLFLEEFLKNPPLEPDGSLNPFKQRQVLDHYQTAASAIARFQAANTTTNVERVNATVTIMKQIEEHWHSLTTGLNPFEQFMGQQMRNLAQRWLDGNPSPTLEDQFFFLNVVFTPAVTNRASRDLAQVRSWLLDRLGAESSILFADVACIELRDMRYDATQFVDRSDRMTRVTMRYLAECLCRTLNPPCPSCDDTSVLLACIEVEACKVTHICNSERTYVLSPRAFRYWIPFLGKLGQAIEELCCTYTRDLTQAKPIDDKYPQGKFFSTTIPANQTLHDDDRLDQVLFLLGLDASEKHAFINVAGSIAGTISDSGRMIFTHTSVFQRIQATPALDPKQFVAALDNERVFTALQDKIRPFVNRTQIQPEILISALGVPQVRAQVVEIAGSGNLSSGTLTEALQRDEIKVALNQAVTHPARTVTAAEVASTFSTQTVRNALSPRIKEYLTANPPALNASAVTDVMLSPQGRQVIGTLIGELGGTSSPLDLLNNSDFVRDLSVRLTPLLNEALQSASIKPMMTLIQDLQTQVTGLQQRLNDIRG